MPFIQKIELINDPIHEQEPDTRTRHKPTNMNHTMTSDYYYNNVKFAGSAVEQSGDVMTVLLYFALLGMMALNAWPNLNLNDA